MKSIFRFSALQSSKCMTNISSLSRINRYKFSQQSQEEKSLEFSDLDDENTTVNPLIQSLSENKTFQEVAPDPTTRKRRAEVEKTAWYRQSRTPWGTQKEDAYSGILNASSVKEVREELELFKSRTIGITRKRRKSRIMDILDSIVDDADDTEQQIDKEESDSDTVGDGDDAEEDMIVSGRNTNVGNAYVWAIKMCGFLKDFDEGFKLFQEAKQDKNIINARVFGAAMWLTMEQDFCVDALERCYELLDDLQNNYTFNVSGYVYAELIKNATALRQYRRGSDLIKRISDTENMDILIRSRPLRNAMINHYAKTKQIEKGLYFMQKMNEQLGAESLDDVVFSTMLSGVALAIKSDDSSMIKAAEKLFEQSFKILDRAPEQTVFSALLTCYGYIPDIESCIDILKTMVSNKDWPDPDERSYAVGLKCLTAYNKEPLSYEKGWKYAQEILDLMDETGGNIHLQSQKQAIYGLLFNLCGGSFCNQSDLERLYIFYDDMVNKGIKLNPMSANSLLLSGVDHYKLQLLNDPDNLEEIKKDLMKYIDWALLQFKKYNLNLTKQQNETLEWKLNAFC